MESTVKRLRSVAAAQKASLQASLKKMTPASGWQVAATTAAVVRTLCTVVADILEAEPEAAAAVENDKATAPPHGKAISLDELTRKFLERESDLRKATSNGDWEAIERLTDSFIESLQESIESETGAGLSGNAVA